MLWGSLSYAEARDVVEWMKAFDLEQTKLLIKSVQPFIFGSNTECGYVILGAAIPEQCFHVETLDRANL
ncbi:hypothetical protein BDF19DRAFT_426423 [Syncephalis fuscata]|nr:hypothetical protein BDF19DRAFT_426423 [Syncephalis fuscata]